MEQISPPDFDGVERALILHLEKCVRQMFGFSGWEDDVDADAAQSVKRVQAVLNDLNAIRRIKSALSASMNVGDRSGD